MTSRAAIRGLAVSALLVPQVAPSRAAEPVVDCGAAFLKLEATFARRALRLASVFCTNPAAFDAKATYLVQTTNQHVAGFNARFAAAGCDPDVSLPVPAKTTADVMLVLQSDAGSIPLDRFCNGIDDPDTNYGNDQGDPGEACDGIHLGGQTCESLANGTGTLGCTVDCRFDLSGCTGPPYCGNGRTEGSEQCDTAGPSASCDRDCTVPLCGDGETNPFAGEQCDDGNLLNGDGCSSLCLFD